jgi:hypothetical protein
MIVPTKILLGTCFAQKHRNLKVEKLSIKLILSESPSSFRNFPASTTDFGQLVLVDLDVGESVAYLLNLIALTSQVVMIE